MDIVFIILGMALLIKGADLLVDGASNIARSFGIPTLIIGLTIVAFGTSAPEAAVSVTASVAGKNALSLGNAVGSNICNMLLVLGTCGLFGKLVAKREVVKRDYVYVIISSIMLTLMAIECFINGGKEGIITRTNGLVLLLFLSAYMYNLLKDAKTVRKQKEKKEKFRIKDVFLVILGIAGIIIGGEIVVNGAIDLAKNIGVSESVIALSIIAVGTSLPELVTSVVAVKKGESDIAIGNVVGSNIFNILFVLGLSSTISPITYGFESMMDIVIMLSVCLLVYLFLLRKSEIGRIKGSILLILYFSYMTYIFIR